VPGAAISSSSDPVNDLAESSLSPRSSSTTTDRSASLRQAHFPKRPGLFSFSSSRRIITIRKSWDESLRRTIRPGTPLLVQPDDTKYRDGIQQCAAQFHGDSLWVVESGVHAREESGNPQRSLCPPTVSVKFDAEVLLLPPSLLSDSFEMTALADRDEARRVTALTAQSLRSGRRCHLVNIGQVAAGGILIRLERELRGQQLS
jgi:hypothetical protein